MSCFVICKKTEQAQDIIKNCQQITKNIDKRFYNKLFGVKGYTRYYCDGVGEQNTVFYLEKEIAVPCTWEGAVKSEKSIFYTSCHPYGSVYILN